MFDDDDDDEGERREREEEMLFSRTKRRSGCIQVLSILSFLHTPDPVPLYFDLQLQKESERGENIFCSCTICCVCECVFYFEQKIFAHNLQKNKAA